MSVRTRTDKLLLAALLALGASACTSSVNGTGTEAVPATATATTTDPPVDPASGEKPAETTAETKSTTVTDGQATKLELSQSKVEVPPNALPPGTKLAATNVAPKDVPQGATPLGPALQVSASTADGKPAQAQAPLSLEMSTPPPAPGESVFILVAVPQADGSVKTFLLPPESVTVAEGPGGKVTLTFSTSEANVTITAISAKEPPKVTPLPPKAPDSSVAVATLPACDAALDRRVVYVVADEMFHLCKGGAWSNVPLVPANADWDAAAADARKWDGGAAGLDAAAGRAALGLGAAATRAVGTSAGQVVALDGTGKMPALNGAALTGLTAAHLANGSVPLAKLASAGCAAGQTLTYDTGSSALQCAAFPGGGAAGLPKGYVYGLDLAWATTTTVTIGAGQARASDDTADITVAAPITVDVSASGANGLDTGTVAASTWYSVWVIKNGGTVSGLLSTSETAPTLPSGYTAMRRVGWIKTKADSTIKGFAVRSGSTYGRYFSFGVSDTTNEATWINSSTVTNTIAITAYAPPGAHWVNILARIGGGNGAVRFGHYSNPGVRAMEAFAANNVEGNGNTGVIEIDPVNRTINAWWANVSAPERRFYVMGWYDPL